MQCGWIVAGVEQSKAHMVLLFFHQLGWGDLHDDVCSSSSAFQTGASIVVHGQDAKFTAGLMDRVIHGASGKVCLVGKEGSEVQETQSRCGCGRVNLQGDKKRHTL